MCANRAFCSNPASITSSGISFSHSFSRMSVALLTRVNPKVAIKIMPFIVDGEVTKSQVVDSLRLTNYSLIASQLLPKMIISSKSVVPSL